MVMLNPTNLRLVAKDIEKYSQYYNQDQWNHDCGAPSCIAGFAARRAVGSDEEYAKLHLCALQQIAEDFLGLPTGYGYLVSADELLGEGLFQESGLGWEGWAYKKLADAEAMGKKTWPVAVEYLNYLADKAEEQQNG